MPDCRFYKQLQRPPDWGGTTDQSVAARCIALPDSGQRSKSYHRYQRPGDLAVTQPTRHRSR